MILQLCTPEATLTRMTMRRWLYAFRFLIKDIHRVLDLKIQTISLGALLLLVWNGASVNFLSREFYVDFDNLSIRGITEFRLNRRVTLSEGKLGILEPEK